MGKIRLGSHLWLSRAALWFTIVVLAGAMAGCETVQTILRATPEPVFSRAAVAADHPVASQAGVEILQRGGNAVDAAVATSFCLSVVRPYSCGIGGGGFMLIYRPGDEATPPLSIALDYRESGPAAVGPDYFLQRDDAQASRFGHHAVAVPGTVAGLAHALEKYGTMSLAEVLEPAIRAAEEGVPADANFVAAAQELADNLEENPALMKFAAPIWQELCRSGALKAGDIVKQPDQARALRLIAQHGPEVFYRGEIGHAIFATMHTHGGPITMSDLKAYKVRELQPLHGTFRGYTVLSMPPPSSGGIAIQQILGMLERTWKHEGRGSTKSPAFVHGLVEAMKHAFADRARWLADPDFHEVPTERLLAAEYLNQRAASITPDRTHEPEYYGTLQWPSADAGTSHFSVIDASGMAVACTETINLNFGSLVTVPGFGFVLNNEMDDFTTRPGEPNAFGLVQSERNAPQAGKRPLSSMSPTIFVKDGRAVLMAGASGGPRIITGTTQAIVNTLVFDMTPLQAVSEARVHHQWLPNVLQLEPGALSRATREDLRRRGHALGSIKVVGQVQMIRVYDDGIRAASDPRKGGAPAGY